MKIYVVRLEIGRHVLPGTLVAGVPVNTDFILGRNVLNLLSVTLNGPASTTEIPES